MKITLCGSARFEKNFKWANEKLTLAGHTVYSLAVYMSDKPAPVDGVAHEWYTPHEKEILDLIHLSKILNSDAIFVINDDGYIGPSTKREINWAVILDKPVYFMSSSVLDSQLSLIPMNVRIDTQSNTPPLRKSVSAHT